MEEKDQKNFSAVQGQPPYGGGQPGAPYHASAGQYERPLQGNFAPPPAYSAQQWQQPQPGSWQPVYARKTGAFGVVSLVMGILSVCMAWWGWMSFIALAFGVASIILGVAGRRRGENALATAGWILGVVGACICVLFLFFYLWIRGMAEGWWNFLFF